MQNVVFYILNAFNPNLIYYHNYYNCASQQHAVGLSRTCIIVLMDATAVIVLNHAHNSNNSLHQTDSIIPRRVQVMTTKIRPHTFVGKHFILTGKTPDLKETFILSTSAIVLI